MLEEVTQPNYKSFTFPRLSDCQKSHIDSIIIFRKKIIIKKKYLSNWGLRVACFKCKPACLEHPHRSNDSERWSWRIDPSVSGKKRKTKKAKQKASPDSVRKQVKLYLKRVKWSHLGSRHVFLSSLQTKSITEHHFGTSFGLSFVKFGVFVRTWAGLVHLFSPTWIFWWAWSSSRFFQALAGWLAGWPPSSGFFQVGRIAYPYNLQPGSAETYFYNLYYFI